MKTKKIGGWEGEITQKNRVAIYDTLKYDLGNIRNAIRDLDERVGRFDGQTKYYSL